jgi:hypothetical protein
MFSIETSVRQTPRIHLRFQSVNGRLLPAGQAMHRQPLGALPSLDRPDVPVEVSGDFLPGIENVTGRARG